MDRAENERARAKLEQFEGMVRTLALRWQIEGIELDDLLQEGRRAVLRAAEKFDPKLGSLSDYTWQAISFAMADFVKDHHSTIRVPRYQFAKVWMRCSALDSPVFDDGETTLAERVAAPGPELEDEWDDDEREVLLSSLRRCLTARELLILRALYFEGQTPSELARQLGCSTQNIHQIRARLLRLLRGQRAVREIHHARRRGQPA